MHLWVQAQAALDSSLMFWSAQLEGSSSSRLWVQAQATDAGLNSCTYVDICWQHGTLKTTIRAHLSKDLETLQTTATGSCIDPLQGQACTHLHAPWAGASLALVWVKQNPVDLVCSVPAHLLTSGLHRGWTDLARTTMAARAKAAGSATTPRE